MYVIGTAGHVDHGKSTLIQALTGINPDRLAEEQARQMTIDLGFAWYAVPSGEEIGIVDVPGHRDFIDNMLAGVGGIDLVLFVVAADEGIMPQSREHLNIVKLLGIQHGLIVLTKIDLVEDDEWLNLVEADIRDLVADSFLEEAPIIRVSAIKKEGLSELSNAIDDQLPNIHKDKHGTTPRLPIDRVFSLHGFGTIVTGTLIDGSFSAGEQVMILPSGILSRIRGIQTHKKKQEVAYPGNRTAINLSGVDVEDITRGDVVCLPDTFSPTNMLDIEVKVLKDYSNALHHDDEVKVFLGTSQTIARVRVLGRSEILPGETGYAQLMISGQVVAKKNDRLILRRPSPASTIGGGVVVNAFPNMRHKRFAQKVIDKLTVTARGSDEERILLAISESGFTDLFDISNKTSISEKELLPMLQNLVENETLHQLKDLFDDEKQWYSKKEEWVKTKKDISKFLNDFHQANRLKKGVNFHMIQNHLKIEKRLAQAIIHSLISEGFICEEEKYLRMPDFAVCLTKAQEKMVDEIVGQFVESGYQTPSVKEMIAIAGNDLFDFLIESGRLIMITQSVLFLPQQIKIVEQATLKLLDQKQRITVADFRDHFNTSRKYAVALLEYLDEQKITIRKDDFRIKNTD